MADDSNETLLNGTSSVSSTKQHEATLDNLMKLCGDFSCYQLIHFSLLSVVATASGITAYFYVFGVAEPLFRCRLPSVVWPNDDQFKAVNNTHQFLIDTWQSSTSRCQWINGSQSTEFVYDRSVFGRTFTEEADFVCDDAVRRT